MLYIEEARAGKYRQELHSAAKRFWEMHQGESFYVLAWSSGRKEVRFSIRTHGDEIASAFTVRTAEDAEEAILAALENWWAGR
jgi:hypothetical protein